MNGDLRRVHCMDDNELIGLDRWGRVCDGLEKQGGKFLGWGTLIILTEGHDPAATASIGGADDRFSFFQKGQGIEQATDGRATLWLLIWRECGCDLIQVLYLTHLHQHLRPGRPVWEERWNRN